MITLIIFLLVLGSIVFFHELGHFIFAKKSGVYVYEFSLGFGPKIFSFKRKNDETEYFIRWIPLGGYVALAGETNEENNKIKVPEEKKLYNAKWINRLLIMVAGVLNNFILAIVILFFIGLFNGSTFTTNIVDKIDKSYPLYKVGVRNGDKIISINNAKINDFDDIQVQIALAKEKSKLNIKVVDKDNKERKYKVKPSYDKKNKKYYYGITTKVERKKGVLAAFKYSLVKFKSIYKQMFIVVKSLFTGKIGLNSLSGPVGIYSVVGQAKSNIFMILYLTAYLSINVGFINLLPFPAFDGGHVLFLIIEKIKGSKVNPKLEDTLNTVGFIILMALMVIITIKDVLNLF